MKENTKQPATKRDRALTIIGIVLCVILIPMLIINVTMIIKSYVNEDEVPSFFGVMPMFVESESMEETIYGGDLIFCTEVDPAEIEVNDIISYFDLQSRTGETIVTHRVVSIDNSKEGMIIFQTKGDNNNANDPYVVHDSQVVGEYWFRVPYMGSVAMFLQTTPGLILCCVVPLVLLIGYELLRRKLYDKNKEEDMNDLMAELEALRAAKAARA